MLEESRTELRTSDLVIDSQYIILPGECVLSKVHMDFNLRVFISSTTVDLVDYRQAADRAIRALGATSDDMVLWSADERDGSAVSLDRVRQCDVVILIVAHRYGCVPDGVAYSITEQEYRTAQAAGIPVLAFLLDETVPWPPKFIERDRPADLTRFRQGIEKHVTRQLFRSPDELSRLITQALVAFAGRTKVARRQRLSEHAIAVAAPIQLKSVPDAVVPLGHAEDDSPLLLRVTRSIDFTPLLDRLAQAVSRPAAEFPSALFKTFQQSLQETTRTAWTSERLKLVTMRDRSERQMYVTSATLSNLFRPLLSLLLSTPVSPDGDLRRSTTTVIRRRLRRRDHGDQATAVAWPANPETSTPVGAAALQSVGGRNRFLGVALDDGGIFSVGYEGDRCVEWRPFVCESLPSHVPQGRFRAHWSNGTADGTFEGILAEYQANLDREARRFPIHSGAFRLDVVVSLPRSSLAELLAKIADQLAHTTFIHGDLKAGNVILARKGPLLIDAFELREGVRSPGWSPNWSAPEQVLGLPVTPAADVYPLGVMLVQLLDGELLGEVRKFRTLPTPDGRDEFSVFYDPNVYVRSDVEWPDRSRTKWLAFARSCLRFDPEKRCESAAAFRDQIRSLLHDHPLPASKRLDLFRQAWPATLIDGTDRLATIIDDVSPSIPTDFDPAQPALPPSAPTLLLGPSDPPL